MAFGWFGKKEDKKDPLGHARRVMSANMEVDFNFNDYNNRHIFNKVSHSSQYGFYYSPYGYFFRYPRWGTLNETGFRCEDDIPDVRIKDPDAYIIAVFGGSTGFSILVPDHETFSAQLERLIKEDTKLSQKIGRKVRVINLSHPGNLVLNQIINFTLFSPVLKPDMVICHNGANDTATLQMNDKNLVSRYGIGYCDVLEAWGRKIHDCTDVEIDYEFAEPTASNFRPAQCRNSPEDIMWAYHLRVKQFNQISKAAGATFISGFQPWVFSKGTLHPEEDQKLRSYNPFYQTIYRNCPDLYDRYEAEVLYKNPADNTVNLHRRFKELGSDIEHFGDICHTYAPGDLIIAEEYYKKVKELFGN